MNDSLAFDEPIPFKKKSSIVIPITEEVSRQESQTTGNFELSADSSKLNQNESYNHYMMNESVSRVSPEKKEVGLDHYYEQIDSQMKMSTHQRQSLTILKSSNRSSYKRKTSSRSSRRE